MLLPYWGIELLLDATTAIYVALEGIQSKMYRKKGGKTAFKLEFELIVNNLVGYINWFSSALARDIVTLPLTTFNPKSRNTTSKKLINVYVCTTNAIGYGMNINDWKSPGNTVTLIRNALGCVVVKKPPENVPMSFMTSLVPALHRNSGPTLFWLLLEFRVKTNSKGSSVEDELTHDEAEDTIKFSNRRTFPRDAINIDAAERPIKAFPCGTTRTRMATPESPLMGLPPAS